MPRKNGFNIESTRSRLAEESGPRFWRSLEELAQTDEFQKCLEREFPENASEWSTDSSRRRFLQLMGASLALAGLNGCAKKPEEKIVPNVRAPEYRIPGKPWHYASAFCMGGFAKGVLVESHMGRPTKVEGNEKHPASLGATDIFAQASLLTLYDPDRSTTVLNANQIGTWNSFLTDFAPRLSAFNANQGEGLRILTETTTSPTFASQMESLLKQFPKAKWHQFEPINRDNERAGLGAAFGQDLNPVYDLRQADVILSLGADFLISGPASIPCARQFMSRRDVSVEQKQAGEMNRLYVVESTPTSTGAKADHRLALSPSEIETFAVALAARLGVQVSAPDEDSLKLPPGFLDALVDDLKGYRAKKNPGTALVVAGAQQSALVHAVAHAINAKLGSIGRAVEYTEAIEVHPVDHADSLKRLVDAMNAGEVDTLVVIDANPVYNAPPALKFVEALAKANYRVHLGLYRDETAWYCDWHIPETHYLESWSDARAYDGTTTIIQPLIRPLYDGKSRHELITAITGHAQAKGHEIVKKYWQSRQNRTGKSFDDWWDTCLHDGVVPDTKAKPVSVSLSAELASALEKLASASAASGGIELTLQPDPGIWDGRWANNGWLQELPKPISKLTWDNAALVSPAFAKENDLENEDVVEIKVDNRTLRVPVLIQPGQADKTVTVNLGFGRSRTGNVGTGVGKNAYQLQSQASSFQLANVSVTKTDESHQLALTQTHHLMEGRHLVRSGTIDELKANPEHPSFMTEGHHAAHEPISLYPDYEYDGYKWGMSINLGGCIGCNACVVACQAENNIPIVGKEEVARGREMQWIRIDQYYEGESADPAMHFQPVTCMQCEKAPCEVVCPVAATTHSPEGLNEMTYNRCIGTRYCANNCPYKVRRFNFFHYTKPVEEHDTLKMMQNPDVSVRARGVMEKCTYCVQRISQARITAEKEQRSIKDGEVVTACQSACPTQAIVFGDLNDPNSKVTQAKNQPLDYVLLEEVNARPRTSYLASVFNPNPKLVPAEQHEPAH